MGKILILVDNSNVFISGKEVYDDETVRFSYSAFERICAGEDDIIEKHLAGSVPPSSDAFGVKWKMRDIMSILMRDSLLDTDAQRKKVWI